MPSVRSTRQVQHSWKETRGDAVILGEICARVLIVSSGCPTSTCAIPAALPASVSFKALSELILLARS